ncbi:MAG: hypothetical protein GTN81_14115 [Proteobacteria bacterium]|nr:hypothetical protein [Pseudomonadota bacterium]
MRGVCVLLSFLVLVLTSFSLSVGSEPSYKSTYVGQEKREIKSLSEQDIEELKKGSGWGLAKAAELNGLPGPKHILEMKKEIGLTSDQEKQIENVYESMNRQAVKLGHELIELERELNNHFANKTINEKVLRNLLDKIATTYRELRFVHLSAHLRTPDILRKAQIEQYNKLRGYDTDDPCVNIPEGHDPEMWKKHHRCP